MSHNTGTVQVLGAPLIIGPGPATIFNPAAAPGGTKFLMLHFQNLDFKPGDNRKDRPSPLDRAISRCSSTV